MIQIKLKNASKTGYFILYTITESTTHVCVYDSQIRIGHVPPGSTHSSS